MTNEQDHSYVSRIGSADEGNAPKMEIMSTISAVNSSPKPTAQDDLIIPISQRKTMITLLPDDCRWPIGDPQVAGFHFCGKRKQDGHPYCEFHVRRASTPGRARVMTYRPRDAA
jgi:GcrA cell cycle regulator